MVVAHRRYSWLVDVHMETGALSKVFISSLAAFWPGMQALIGEPRPPPWSANPSLHIIAVRMHQLRVVLRAGAATGSCMLVAACSPLTSCGYHLVL